MSERSRRDQWSAAGLAVLALGYLLAGRQYPLDTLATPGPGIFPLAVGLALLALAIWQLLAGGRRPALAAVREADEVGISRAPLIMIAVLVLYAVSLPRLGFTLTSFVLVLVASWLMGLRGWWQPVVLALGVTVVSRLIFGFWLGVPLP
ncbi:MAG TPA: tripartite tricarboxylate transporter TctB family protein [Patescibacteria group bacterium]|nr:tripartite tricarboxylate transporter TctB family protein [Patescibacteria group bacterium]